MENTTNRKLASIQVIDKLTPIEGADKIEQATLVDLGWSFVVKKGEFKPGDKCVYFEIDSILPEKAEFEFLRPRKFRIKTIKLKGIISQGLVIPVPDGMQNIPVGTNITDAMGVKKYDPQVQEEAALSIPKHRSKVMQYLMQFKACRYIYLKLNSQEKGNWPGFAASKTDEERIQNCAKIVLDHFNEEWYITEKSDGQSGTFFTYDRRVCGIKRRAFGVCSRNIWLKTKHSCNYWDIAEKYDLERKMKAYSQPVVIQGEICGPKIQKNKYRLKELDLFVFNVYIGGKMLSVDDMEAFCKINGLRSVHIITKSFIPAHVIATDINGISDIRTVVNYFIDMAIGNTAICGADAKALSQKREGLVIRLKSNPKISFKAINPQFLLENDE